MISPHSFFGNVDSTDLSSKTKYRFEAANLAATHDAELVRRFNAGDESAFVEIITRHRRKIFSVALGHLRNHADAEEITQDTFIRAYRGLANFRGESSLACWLHRIVFNLSRNRYGYFFRRHRHETSSLDCAFSHDNATAIGDLVASEAPDPAREETNREFNAQVQACMAKLSERQRKILTQRNQLNHSYDKIADTLGITSGTVKSRIARARNKLRILLAESYHDSTAADSPPSFQWFDPVRKSGGLLSVAC